MGWVWFTAVLLEADQEVCWLGLRLTLPFLRENSQTMDYSIVISLRNRLDDFRWTLITVYGPAHHDMTTDFLRELSEICNNETLPIMIFGDFNLIRESKDKCSAVSCQLFMDLFNDFIGCFQLREIIRTGLRYTWSDKRPDPIRINLDTLLVSSTW